MHVVCVEFFTGWKREFFVCFDEAEAYATVWRDAGRTVYVYTEV